MKRLLVTFGLTILVCELHACDCTPINRLEEHFRNADIVFYAKVKSINDRQIEGFTETMHFSVDSLYTNKGGYHPQLKIIKIIKGNFKSDVLSKEIFNYQSMWTNCDVFFMTDSEYIVFGNFDEHGKFQTSICSATTAVTDKKLLRLLEKIE